MRVVVTGATGFLGVPLVAALRARGDDVTVLTRDRTHAQQRLGAGSYVEADLETPGEWTDALAGQHAIVHLAGASIAETKWDARGKQIMRDSRVETTRTLVEAIAALDPAARPRVLVSASGTDYYPFAQGPDDFTDDPVTEQDPPSDSFLGRLCRDWEREARVAESLGVRVVTMRTGLVLARDGGALARMRTPFRFFFGGRIATGRQFVSWIHRDDAVAAYVAALADERYVGPINLVAGSIRNRDFARSLGRALHRPSWLPVPRFALRAAAGELADYMLHGRNVVPAKLDALGFLFTHRAIDDALAAIYSSSNSA
jgi:uncharacterized protein (TIGR01777 family)